MKSFESILTKHVTTMPFLAAAIVRDEGSPLLERLSRMVTGPVLLSYVWWILQDALKRNIHTLYFLARDGYVLREIADLFCQHFNLDMECRYLYCSRASLRMPTYHFVGDEAYDFLFVGGYNVTPNVLLQRVGFTAEEHQILYNKCEISSNREHERLSQEQLMRMRSILVQDPLYRGTIEEKSQDALIPTLGYLKQEGLLDSQYIAIVDSGWTGSMQRSLRQLIERSGNTSRLMGYYFGMYANPKEEKDGEYLTWYFDRKSNLKGKIAFCNNLFECMLSAPHGMTIAYQTDQQTFSPVFNSAPSIEMIEYIKIQQKGILSYVQEALGLIKITDFTDFNPDQHLDLTYQLLRRLMQRPTAEEAVVFGKFSFSDEFFDEITSELASPEHIKALENHLIFRRIWRRMKKEVSPHRDLFWPQGAIAFLEPLRREWYLLNINLWECLKYTLK